MEPWKVGMYQKSAKNKNKKKIQKNGFFYFMMEYNKSKLEGKCTDFKRLENVAGQVWQVMSIEERQPYELMASKARNRIPLDSKLNTGPYGTPYTDIPETIKRQNEMMTLAREDIATTVAALDAASSLQTYKFYFVHANSHVLTSSGIVVPCELAICRYSIREGVIDAYNVILNIRPIPLGYAADAQQNSANLHKIPAPAEKLGETNARKVYLEMLQFLMPDEQLHGDLEDLVDVQFPPVYSVQGAAELTGKCINAVQACCMSAGDSPIPLLNVYPIECLLHNILKNIISSVRLGNADVPEETEAIKLAENENLVYPKFHYDYYSQAPDIACEYHEEQDCREHCSKSWATRMSYTVSDYCCNLVGVKRQKWRHYASNNYNVAIRTSSPVFLNGNRPHQLNDPPVIDEENFPKVEDSSRFKSPADANGPATPIVKRKPLQPDAPPFEPPYARATSVPPSSTQSFGKVPPTPHSFYDDDDDDASSIISSSSISSLRSLKKSLDIDSVLSLAGQNPSPLTVSKPPIALHGFDLDESQYELVRSRASVDRMEDDDDIQSVATTADSFSSVPLQRYRNKPTISVTNMNNILAKPVPERSSSSFPYTPKVEPVSFSLEEFVIPAQGGPSSASCAPTGQMDDDDEDMEDEAARIFTRLEQERDNAAAAQISAQRAIPPVLNMYPPQLGTPADYVEHAQPPYLGQHISTVVPHAAAAQPPQGNRSTFDAKREQSPPPMHNDPCSELNQRVMMVKRQCMDHKEPTHDVKYVPLTLPAQPIKLQTIKVKKEEEDAKDLKPFTKIKSEFDLTPVKEETKVVIEQVDSVNIHI